MDERVLQFRIGVMVVGTVFIAAFLVLAFNYDPALLRGRYTVYRAVDGPVTNSLGQLWRPRFFHRGIAVHGSQNIPPWPDSHGCARLSNAAINMIWASDLMPIGSRVVVR